MELLEIIKAMADLNRLRILYILNKYGKCCNCDIEEILQMEQSNTSRHLAKLKQILLVKIEKKGKWIYYQLNEELMEKYPYIKNMLDDLNDEIYKEDSKRFEIFNKNKEKCN